MSRQATAPLRHPHEFFIDGGWVQPSSDAKFEVIDPSTEELFFRVAEAQSADMDRAIAAAHRAFHEGPWPRLAHAQRAQYLRAIATALRERSPDIAQIWPRQSGILYAYAAATSEGSAREYEYYAGLADTFEWDEPAKPTVGQYGLITREPVGVVGAIIPWNSPLGLITHKVAPALLAGCTVVLKASPEAPGEALVMAEIFDSLGLPPGVVNVVTADRAVSEQLVRDPRIDKIAFTGSTEAGRKIAAIMGDRIGRYTLELGGKSAAVVLDDMELGKAASILAGAECLLAGQVCSSLTRIVVSRHRHDDLVEALSDVFSAKRLGDPFEADTQMGPLAMSRQRDRVEGFIATGVQEGAKLVTGGGRPKHLDRGWFVEPTVFGNVDNSSVIAQNEIFGPVLSVIAADDEDDAVRIANDTKYGLNASVFTEDVDRALSVARRIRSGTVGHNAFRTDFGMAFGGFKQSGVGREGGREGLLPYVEVKSIILDGTPS
jgi:acyl-CoA reductase-like NAD-dependent aldehyde dehydrogenase